MKQVILGVDPGSRVTGYGVVEFSNGEIRHLAHGTIEAQQETFAERLSSLLDQFEKIMIQFSPQVVVLEKVFLGKNVDSAFKLGHARGLFMALSARCGSSLHEYSTREVKKGITGKGSADKEEVLFCVSRFLNIRGLKSLDASDALALACFQAFRINQNNIYKKMVEAN